jgi:hypothetical protein
MPKRPVGTTSQTRRSAEAAAVVASMQSAGAMHGMSVEDDVDFNMDDFADEEAQRKEPPPSTWFDDLDSGPAPLEETSSSSHH